MTATVTTRQIGKCISWQNTFGFIRSDGKKDVFCHYTSIVGDDRYKCLSVGDNVEYDVEQGDRGLVAKNVQII